MTALSSRKMKRTSFQSSLRMSYIIIMTLLIAFAVTYWGINSSLEHSRNLLTNSRQILNQLAYSVDEFNTELNNVLYYHNEDDDLRFVYSAFASPGYAAPPSETAFVREALDSLVRFNSLVDAIIYVSPENGICCFSDGFEMAEEEIRRLIDTVPDRQHTSLYCDPVYGILGGSRVLLLPVVRRIADIKTGHELGFILTFSDSNHLFPQFDAASGVKEGYNTMIYSSPEHLLYHTNLSSEYFKDRNRVHSYEEIMQLIEEGKTKDGSFQAVLSDLVISSFTHRGTGWTLVKFGNATVFASRFQYSVLFFIVACLVFYLILIVVSHYLSSAISRDLLRLHSTICSVDVHQLNKVTDVSLPDNEIGDLIVAYNEMIDKMTEGIQREYMLALRNKETQIQMLTFQIDPHYLYNCLNLITSLAVIHDVPDISSVSSALGDMFRYNTSTARLVTIEDEVNILKEYILIQMLRYPHRFDIHYLISPEACSSSCIKFLLQPLVENCFKHAFRLDKNPAVKKQIYVTIDVREEKIFITVKDDGIGINREKLDYINRILREHRVSRPEDIGIGIWNLNQRVYYEYGDHYGLTLESTEGEYTAASLVIPWLTSAVTKGAPI